MIKLLEHIRRPDVSFFYDGKIEITARIANALSLKPGDAINIMSHDGEFYLFVNKTSEIGKYHAQCYPTKKGSRNYRAHSSVLCRNVMRACGVHSSKVALACGEPVSISGKIYLPLITKNPL